MSLALVVNNACTHADHDRLRANPERAKYKGLWALCGEVLQMYECPHCGSDIYVAVDGAAMIPDESLLDLLEAAAKSLQSSTAIWSRERIAYPSEEDAALILACSPGKVVALVTELRRLRGAR